MLAILLASVNSSLAQKWAVKSNLLYDATATINLGVEAALGPPRNAGHIGQLQSVGVRRRPVETLADTTRSTLLALRALQRPLFRIARPLRRIQCGRDQFQRRFPPQPLSGAPLRCGFILRLSVADRQAVEPRSHSRPGVRRLWDRNIRSPNAAKWIRTRSRTISGRPKSAWHSSLSSNNTAGYETPYKATHNRLTGRMPDLHRGSLRSRGNPAAYREGDRLCVRLPITAGIDLPANGQLTVTPVVSNGENQILLAPRRFHGDASGRKSDERRERLYGIPAVPEGVFSNTVIRRSRKNPSANAVLFEGDIPYEPWMAGGRIVLYRDLEDVPDTGRPFRRWSPPRSPLPYNRGCRSLVPADEPKRHSEQLTAVAYTFRRAVRCCCAGSPTIAANWRVSTA